jgi:hypothetical protein
MKNFIAKIMTGGHKGSGITASRLLTGLALLYLVLALEGCAGSKIYGKNQLSEEVKKSFKAFQVLPDHNYYYSGSKVEPDAILAVHQSYVLTSDDLWTKTAPDSKQLKFWVETKQGSIANPAYGYAILTPDGKQIGIIYTRWDPGPVEMGEGNQVSIYLPSKDRDKRSRPRLMY